MAEAARWLRTQHAILNYGAVYLRERRELCPGAMAERRIKNVEHATAIMCVQHTPWCWLCDIEII